MEREALVESAIASAAATVDIGLPEDSMIISCKVSRLGQMVSAYQTLAKLTDIPLHLGLTEAGMDRRASSRQLPRCAVLLYDGIGDTIRSSLTPEIGGDRANEVKLCQDILQSLGIRTFPPISYCMPGLRPDHVDVVPGTCE